MDDSGMILTLIGTNLASAFIGFLVTYAYWRDVHMKTLRGIAAERRQDAHAIQNAKIIQRVYGDTLGLDIMEDRR